MARNRDMLIKNEYGWNLRVWTFLPCLFYLFIFSFTTLPPVFTPGLKTQRPWGSSQQLLFAYFSDLSVLLVHLPKTDTETHTCSHIRIHSCCCRCQCYFGWCRYCCWHEIAVNNVVCLDMWCHTRFAQKCTNIHTC